VRVVARRDSVVDRLLTENAVPTISTSFRGGADPRGLWAVIRTVKTFDPDWIVTNRCKLYWPMVAIGLLFDVRVALFRHLTYLKRWNQRRLLPRLADRFYVVSQYAQDVLVAGGAPRERLTPLYNPIDTQRFQPLPAACRRELRAQLGLRAEDIVVGFVGRIEDSKGVIPLREAMHTLMQRLPALKMLWVGDGSAAPRTRAFAAFSGHADRHLFAGWQPQVERYMAALDILIAPSIEPETFGRVVAEAQACAVPVIASGAGGLQEAFLPGATGLLVERVDAETLRIAIERLIRDPALRSRLAERGPEFVSARFAADKIAAAFTRHLAAMPLPACDVGTEHVTQKHLIGLSERALADSLATSDL
jgi:glycosyltransferase involved in cell wall biosynthesis